MASSRCSTETYSSFSFLASSSASVKQPVEPAGDVDLVGAPPGGGHFGQLVELGREAAVQVFHGHAGFQQNGSGQSVLLLQQGREYVLDVNLLMTVADSLSLCGL